LKRRTHHPKTEVADCVAALASCKRVKLLAVRDIKLLFDHHIHLLTIAIG